MIAGQDVVEVVRDAAGQLADRLHLLRLAQLRLEPGGVGLGALSPCDVACDRQHMRRPRYSIGIARIRSRTRRRRQNGVIRRDRPRRPAPGRHVGLSFRDEYGSPGARSCQDLLTRAATQRTNAGLTSTHPCRAQQHCVGRGIEDRAVLLLARPQRFLGLLAFGDVARNREHVRLAAMPERDRMHLGPDALAAPADRLELGLAVLAAQRPPHEFQARLAYSAGKPDPRSPCR